MNLAVEAPTAKGPTGMANSVLAEVQARLAAFADTGAESAIDLAGLPLTMGDRDELDQFLGRGEVGVSIDVAGLSEVWETAFSGVWRVRHWGEGRIAVELIEIAEIPGILKTDRMDARAAADRFARALREGQRGQSGGGL